MSEHEALPRDGEATQQPMGGEAEPRPVTNPAPVERPGRPIPERGRETRAPSRRARAALPLAAVAEGLTARRVSVRPSDVVFVKGLVEASEGLAGVFAEVGGELLLAVPREREAELEELLADLEAELHARVMPSGPHPPTLRHQTPAGQGP
jgi:hypothetical protein